jgi:hypothetical protein
LLVFRLPFALLHLLWLFVGSKQLQASNDTFFWKKKRIKGFVYPLAVIVVTKLKFVIPEMLDETDNVNFT